MKIENSGSVIAKPVEMDGAEGVEIKLLISKDDGANHFVMRMFELKPGGHTPLHTHPHEHEVFILEGEGIFVYEGKEHKFCKDYVIFVPGGKEHTLKNTGDSILRFLCIIPALAV
jgi:quercetin dioxygenase-like cupin family protein